MPMRIRVSSRAQRRHIFRHQHLSGHGTEISLEFVETKARSIDAEVERKVDPVRHLIRAAEVVGVVQETAYAHQTV